MRVVGVSRMGLAGVLSDLAGLPGVCGVGAWVLGEPGEQRGLVGEERGAFGGVGLESGYSGEVAQEVVDLGGGDWPVGCRARVDRCAAGGWVSGHGGSVVWARGRRRG